MKGCSMLKNLNNKQIIELYKKNKEFIDYLDKELKELEKLRYSNE